MHNEMWFIYDPILIHKTACRFDRAKDVIMDGEWKYLTHRIPAELIFRFKQRQLDEREPKGNRQMIKVIEFYLQHNVDGVFRWPTLG